MVGVTIQCRFGNQFFQYFFIKALAERHGTNFFLNQSFERFLLTDYFDLSGYSHQKNQFNKLIFKIRYGLFKKIQNVNIGDFSEVHEDSANFPNHTSYGGYFQSEKFFENLKLDIRHYISLKPSVKAAFEKKHPSLFTKSKTIAVHVRRGDYLDLNEWWEENLGSKNLTLPDQYYENCLNSIADLDRYTIIFISDDINYARHKFGHLPNAIFMGDSLINDFQVLMNADICILSNSSFSWWGAYLNPKKHKIVFCPKNWLGFKIGQEYPIGIIPKEWQQMAVANI